MTYEWIIHHAACVSVCVGVSVDGHPRLLLAESVKQFHTLLPVAQIRRKIRGSGQSGQAIKLFQVPRKISFTFHFWHKSFILDDVKPAELSNNSFEWKNVTF